jgi:hypothetical protein
MRTEMPPPGALDAVFTCTPGAVPWSIWSIEVIGVRSSTSTFTDATEPVLLARVCSW